MMSEDPPKLTKGSGTPVAGTELVVTAMLSKAWNPIMEEIPIANNAPKGSRVLCPMKNPR